jgi:hypothetical protein
MQETITVSEVKKIDEHNIVVIFSDGTSGRYSAKFLASVNELSKRPMPLSGKNWAPDSA